jgi:membrane protein implicated in regulation of membrane protease activity
MTVSISFISINEAAPYLWLGISILSAICAYLSHRHMLVCFIPAGFIAFIASAAGVVLKFQSVSFFLSVILISVIFFIFKKYCPVKTLQLGDKAIVTDCLNVNTNGSIYLHGKLYPARMSESESYIAPGNIVHVIGEESGIYLCKKINKNRR